jgi:hypothetical protein
MSLFDSGVRLFSAVLVAAASSAPAVAHHSHSMFDDSSEVTISGVVSAIRYTNPHVYLLVGVSNSDGSVTDWAVEMSNIGRMMGLGVSVDTFAVGKEVVVAMNPLRSGAPGGNYTHIVSIDGVENSGEGQSWQPAD